MREIDKPIQRVRWCLRFQRFLECSIWCLGIGLLASAGLLLVQKTGHVAFLGPTWLPLGVALVLSLLIAATLALVRGPSRLDAAMAIDRSFQLNERFGTLIHLPTDLVNTPAGQALVADTIHQAESLKIRLRSFARWPRLAWVPIVPALLALGMLLLPDLSRKHAVARGTEDEHVDQNVVSKQAQSLNQALREVRNDLESKQFTDADKLFGDLEKSIAALSLSPPAEKDKALVKLNNLTDLLKERQQQLGSTDQIGRQLQQLKDLTTTGPADTLARELARNNFGKAAEELKKLKEKLASGKLNEKEMEALKRQVADMKEQLEKLADTETRKQQLEEAHKKGALTEDQYRDQKQKLAQQEQNLKGLQSLAQQMGQCQNAMNQGDLGQAAASLGLSQGELEELARQAQELQALDAALADLQDCKSGLCNGGANQLGQGLDGLNGLGQCQGNGNDQKPGRGLGRGLGQGDRPEAPDETAFHNTKTNPQFDKGKAYVTGFGPPGALAKGESQIEVQGELDSAATTAAEALSNQRVPNRLKKHVLDYFDEIRKGN